MFFKYTFADGYEVVCMGFDKVELQHEIARHGKVVKKEQAL